MKNKQNYSRLIAGTMTWGSWGAQLSEAEAAQMIQDCLSMGISTFDHADIYGDYENEALFGKAFVQSGVSREEVQLISKCGIQMTRGRENKVKHYQYDTAYIIDSAERSLRMLQTDYLDLFLLHRPSPLLRAEEVFMAVEQLKSSGKIKQFGVSNFTPSQIALLETNGPVEGNQVECSLLQSSAMLDGTFDDCISGNRMAMAWSPLGGYFGGDDRPESKERKARMEPLIAELSQKYDCGVSALLLAWLYKHPAGIHPVVGSTKKGRLAEMLKASEIEMELQDWFLLWEAARGHRVP
ncbi:aldo/keto reductase [Aureicoccus marinus]|uniref:Aldo/keto reductase n=1 Tax=Aureicoccus marinus TaxID=754435 RepID=A0A2S7TA27_9FLAO|nr:aldo/keto reductase [Aureicoccus marinus]PQJ16345.1 aldo/keto reductase [Aureicoccus marinus]